MLLIPDNPVSMTQLAPDDLNSPLFHGVALDENRYILYQRSWEDIHLAIQSRGGAQNSFTEAEVEIYGYTKRDSSPILLMRFKVDSDVGRVSIPLIADISDYHFLYIRQTDVDNPIDLLGMPGATNPALRWQLTISKKQSGFGGAMVR